MSDSLLHYYRVPGDNEKHLLHKINRLPTLEVIKGIQTEYCFNIETRNGSQLSDSDITKLKWLFVETFQPENIGESSFLKIDGVIIEVGPRLAFTTAWSSNCVSMCHACGIHDVTRIERSRRYLLESDIPLNEDQIANFAASVHDRMTECVYHKPLTSFTNHSIPPTVTKVPILSQGIDALRRINEERGLGFDEWDLEFYTKMFQETLGRDPTDVECFDLGQSNSEHSRHWYFGGRMIIDGEEKKESLFSLVKSTLPTKSNSVIAFHDNSSAIEGFAVPYFHPEDPSRPSSMRVSEAVLHPILTAETHNFPSGVAPFSGAETGTGGRLRDVQATGRGAHTLAGVSSYCVGNLHIPGHRLPWEQDPSTPYPSNLAHPLTIEIEASNGASDYGNKYGEPVVAGFTRSFGQVLPGGERVEYIKPIMFTAGVGILNDAHRSKGNPEAGMIVCKIGGPAYRIGMGGGAASSRVQGTADSSLDFNAVQRGDAEMENRMNRVIRACIDMFEANPIVSIHDQGAGGNGNVLKEIVDPLGARYELRSIPVGDSTLSVSEIWGAEYQENNAFLVRQDDLSKVLELGKRENCPVAAVGVVSGDGRVVVHDSKDDSIPYDMPLSLILGNMPKKSFTFKTPERRLLPLVLPEGATVTVVAERVLRLLDVGSKRFLVNKVDRSVTGLIAQQQTVGPLLTPVSDVAVLALSHFDLKGIALAVGEQPIKGLVNNAAQARMTVGETFTNLVFAKITKLEDVKMSGNWMWAAKMEGEGAKMWEACEALREALVALGPSIDGGKDSLSMAAKVAGVTVKSPGTLTLTAYAASPDITLTITPDLKSRGDSSILFVDLSGGRCRCGGTALSTVYGQIGNTSPDLDDMAHFKRAFQVTQNLLEQRVLLAGHDRSDGGLFVTLVEMAIAGNIGLDIDIPSLVNELGDIGQLFNEELGLTLEVSDEFVIQVVDAFKSREVSVAIIGKTQTSQEVQIRLSGRQVFQSSLRELRQAWESTSFALEKLQCNPECVEEEELGLVGSAEKKGISYILPAATSLPRNLTSRPTIAVIRQEGSNGDREMLAAFFAAGCDVWDVNMIDLVSGKVTLDRFRGLSFCGGFSYADVNDSAKGWAGVIKFNEGLLAQFNWFRDQKDRFSLGVCNGCQLLALLGWIPFPEVYNPSSSSVVADEVKALGWKDEAQPRFLHNRSGRFESRWVTVKILPSSSVLLKGLEGSQLGVWVAHGEGQVYFPQPGQQAIVEAHGLAPIRYVDDDGLVTSTYPMNPNGSPAGIAALCSEDGRHLAIMPHPERCFQFWQWPYKPAGYDPSGSVQILDNGVKVSPSPWIKLFENARRFCDN